MAKFIDVCIFPINKKHLAAYKKSTASVGKILLKHGALASRDFVADDQNSIKLIFPKVIKIKSIEIIIFAVAEFKSKAHREKVFKLMHKDPVMEKLMSTSFMDMKRMVFGGFKNLVDLEK
jgi:uncharacterized protein YbaA (DUF1428 family)